MEEENGLIKEKNNIELNKIQLEREWTFWENYEMKDKTNKIHYSKLIKFGIYILEMNLQKYFLMVKK